MSKELDFSIPETEKRPGRKGMKWVYILLTAIFLISILNAVILYKGEFVIDENNGNLIPPHKELKQLALKLEKQELSKQAAGAWKEYLSAVKPDDIEAARIWYRIGNIFHLNGDFDEALNAYYRSESFSKPDDIKNEINRRIQECLESAGKFAALRYELEERVVEDIQTLEERKTSPSSGEQIVAEIGTYKITRSDLDKKIEKLIESSIGGLSRYLSDDRINKEKENLLKQYSSDNSRRLFLEQYMIEELLYRKARESRLSEDMAIKEILSNMKRSILASKVLENAYTDEIKITATDVKNYYEVNKEKYIKKEEDEKERQMEFEEVKDRVTLDLMSQKEKDVQKRLLAQLKQEYDVVIHNSVLSTDAVNEKK